ncbi:MAG: hypothetical protein SFT90_04850 [Rickettsiales bacterium]|nr:hypothetical protein [Rickettsiales bacterium]
MTNNKDINDKINILNSYINKSEILTRILDKETEFYRANQIEKAAELYETKEKYTIELEQLKNEILSDVNFLKTLPSDSKEKIINVSAALKKASEINYNEVLIAREVNKIVLESVYQSTLEYQSNVRGYGNNGTINAVNSLSSPIAISENA